MSCNLCINCDWDEELGWFCFLKIGRDINQTDCCEDYEPGYSIDKQTKRMDTK